MLVLGGPGAPSKPDGSPQVPRACDDVTVHGQREPADAIRLTTLPWECRPVIWVGPVPARGLSQEGGQEDRKGRGWRQEAGLGVT